MKKHTRKSLDVSNHLSVNQADEFLADLAELPFEGFGGKYLRDSYLSKYCGPGTATSQQRAERAIGKWLATEERNSRTNRRLYAQETYFNFGGDRYIHSDRFLSKVASILSSTLGPVKDLWGSFSSGASTTRARAMARLDEKFAGKAHITEGCVWLWDYACMHNPMLSKLPGEIVTIIPEVTLGNVMFTVPKNAEIDRVACKEPDLNLFIQKGIGDHVRRQLRRKGIDLNDQSRNSDLARQGSISGELATLDLSSASDSITTQLIVRLFSPDWVEILMSSRSPFTSVNGEWHENEMISSMGNGFTFEVESLIFYSIARATAYFLGSPGIISVYGDDLIVPTSVALALRSTLGFCGFILNNSKSFWTGTFRESCGGHWSKGQCVKPFYIRRPVLSLEDLILHLNAVRRWYTVNGICDPRVLPFYMKWAALVPHKLKGPRGGDNYALWTPKGPDMRLQPLRDTIRRNELGSYVAWHHTKAGDVSAPPLQINPKRDTGRYVITRHTVTVPREEYGVFFTTDGNFA